MEGQVKKKKILVVECSVIMFGAVFALTASSPS